MVPFSSTGAASKTFTKAAASSLLENLCSMASVLCAEKMDDFSKRLADAFLHLSEQSVRPKEAELSFNAFNYLRQNGEMFHEAFAEELKAQFEKEIRLTEKGRPSAKAVSESDLSLVTFEEMESTVLLSNVVQALELDASEPLNALNIRLAWVLGRDQLPVTENPFRPQVFVEAVYQAWQRIDPDPESNRIMLHLLGPRLFLPLEPILKHLNESLVEQDILPNLHEAYRLKKAEGGAGHNIPGSGIHGPKASKQEMSRYDKVRNWLLSSGKKGKADQGGKEGAETGGWSGNGNAGSGKGVGGGGGGGRGGREDADLPDLNLPDLFSPDTEGGWGVNTINGKVGPRIFAHLNALQNRIEQLEMGTVPEQVPQSATTLRRVKEAVPSGTLTAVDEQTIELLAGVMDYVFQEREVHPEIKKLLGQLQITLLKAALLDKKFFVKDDHPARRLVDSLAKCSLVLDAQQGREDPLYKMIEQIVTRVQKEFTQQMELFTDAVSGIESLLQAEDKKNKTVLAEPIAKAMRQEKMNQAKEAAEKDVASRIETGEVAGFVESFLETQWVRILTLAHSTKEQKPEVLGKAIKAMDDLIWSIKPKNSPEQRKELINRLPAILAMLNAWLNAIKWHEPERVTFFSNLAERHAAIVRMQPELSPRHNVEIAVNIAEKASARRMRRHAEEVRKPVQPDLQETIDSLVEGMWMEFAREEGQTARLKLAWISPQRTRFIFTNRKEGQPSSLFTQQELTDVLRERKVTLLEDGSIMDKALSAVLEPAH